MGYDMSIVNEMPEAELAAKTEAYAEYQRLLDVRDALGNSTPNYREDPEWQTAQDAVLKAYEAYSTADTHYFRLNIWGMAKCRQAMYELGMIYDGQERTDWPEYSEPERKDFASLEEWSAAAEEYDEEYNERCEPLRSHHPDGDDTIPSFKFGSNDAWHVTPPEAAAAVEKWREFAARFPDGVYRGISQEAAEVLKGEWWPEWIEFIERASKRGGFKVY